MSLINPICPGKFLSDHSPIGVGLVEVVHVAPTCLNLDRKNTFDMSFNTFMLFIITKRKMVLKNLRYY